MPGKHCIAVANKQKRGSNMENQTPREKLFDLIQEYQFQYGVSRKQAVSEMKKALQAKIKTEQYEADTGVKFGKYQTI